jgi:uncharacterized protein YraI
MGWNSYVGSEVNLGGSMKKIVIILIILIAITLLAMRTEVVKRERAIVRTGPGSLFEIVAELAKGTSIDILEEEEGWLKIEHEDVAGYVSGKVIKERKSGDDVFLKMGSQKTDLRISQHGMSAGVKGFAQSYTSKFKGAPDFFDYYANYKLNPKDFRAFRKATYKGFNRKKNYKKIEIPVPETRDFFTFQEEGIGIGIASGIASLGIYNNTDLTNYVNEVGNIVVEATDAYDINFKFFILDTDLVNGYACPGGIVFVTKGMLKAINNEAELACVLAHEIAHIARHHGMIELGERRNQVMADDAFAEMDEEMEGFGIEQDETSKAVEEEMEQLSFEIFETLVNGRLAEYEQEADELAVIYASRAGYDGKSLLQLLNRLKSSASQSTNEHYTQGQISDRIQMVSSYLNRIQLPDNLFKKADRWNQRSGM